MTETRTWRVGVGADDTTVVWDPPTEGAPAAVFVCAHGGRRPHGGSMILAVTDVLRERGVGTVRFNFLYRARGSGRPDPMPRLLECFEAVVAHVQH